MNFSNISFRISICIAWVSICLLSCEDAQVLKIKEFAKADFEVIQAQYSFNGDSIAEERFQIFHLNLSVIKRGNQLIANWSQKYAEGLDSLTENDELFYSPEYSVQGYEFKALLSSQGAIDSIVNWNEILLFTDSVSQVYLNNWGFDSLEKQQYKSVAKDIITPSYIGNKVAKPLYLFHLPYTLNTNLTDTVQLYLTEYLDDYGQIVMPQKVEVLYKDQDEAYLRLTTSVENMSLVNSTDYFFNEILKANFNSLMSDISFEDTVVINYNLELEMAQEINFWRYSSLNGNRFLETISMTQK